MSKRSLGLVPPGGGSEPLKTGFPSLDTASLKDNHPPRQAAELRRVEAPLQPKRLLPVQAAGLRIKELGYDVIALRDGKAAPNIGWPRTPNTPDRIRRWTGRTIAVRLKGSDLFVIDLDVHVAAVRDAILAELTTRWPEFAGSCLKRHSQAITLALIGRSSSAKRSFATRWHIGEGRRSDGRQGRVSHRQQHEISRCAGAPAARAATTITSAGRSSRCRRTSSRGFRTRTSIAALRPLRGGHAGAWSHGETFVGGRQAGLRR